MYPYCCRLKIAIGRMAELKLSEASSQYTASTLNLILVPCITYLAVLILKKIYEIPTPAA